MEESKAPKKTVSSEGIIDDREYKYCYQNLLIEAKEWHKSLSQIFNSTSGKSNSQNKLKPEDTNQKKVRLQKLKETIC